MKQSADHKRVPDDVAENPVIIGHEMCGEIVQVGDCVKSDWKVGQKVVVQPALKLETGYDPGYSYPYIGGNTLYAVVPKIVLERGCLLPSPSAATTATFSIRKPASILKLNLN